MDFSAMTLNMFFPDYTSPGDDQRVIDLCVEQSIFIADLGFNPWYTDHHFRGPWHSNPMQFAAYVVPQISRERYVGFGVLSAPFYHPVRLVESMNLLDQLTKGKALFGIGSGWQGTEAEGLGVDRDYHASGKAAEDTLDVAMKLWRFKDGDAPFDFAVGNHSGHIKRRVMPSPYTKRHPIMIRTASRDAGLVKAAQMGWPAFLGVLGNDVRAQTRLYRKTLAEAGHPQSVVEECLRWCTTDWLAICVARTDEEAIERGRRAQAETMAIRGRYIARHGKLDGPTIQRKPAETVADAYAKGGDMRSMIAGSPQTVARRVRELADLGMTHLMLRFLGEWDGETRWIGEESMRLFANEVAPPFTDVKPLTDPFGVEL